MMNLYMYLLLFYEVRVYEFIKDLFENTEKMSNVSMWLDGRTSILEYAKIPFMSVLYY